jgi:hypothetical protein
LTKPVVGLSICQHPGLGGQTFWSTAEDMPSAKLQRRVPISTPVHFWCGYGTVVLAYCLLDASSLAALGPGRYSIRQIYALCLLHAGRAQCFLNWNAEGGWVPNRWVHMNYVCVDACEQGFTKSISLHQSSSVIGYSSAGHQPARRCL